ncbi:hypothetical protein [Dictyobacter kobayashii]|nr:hypothetical protein [Dictyobacter kobayashii]
MQKDIFEHQAPPYLSRQGFFMFVQSSRASDTMDLLSGVECA